MRILHAQTMHYKKVQECTLILIILANYLKPFTLVINANIALEKITITMGSNLELKKEKTIQQKKIKFNQL